MLTVNTVNFFCAGTFLAPPCCGRCLPRPAALPRCPPQWPAPTPRWRAYRRRPRHALARRRAPRPAGWHDASRRASVCWGEDRTGVLVRPEQEQSRDCELELPARDMAATTGPSGSSAVSASVFLLSCLCLDCWKTWHGQTNRQGITSSVLVIQHYKVGARCFYVLFAVGSSCFPSISW